MILCLLQLVYWHATNSSRGWSIDRRSSVVLVLVVLVVMGRRSFVKNSQAARAFGSSVIGLV
jgi:hypothetical protein